MLKIIKRKSLIFANIAVVIGLLVLPYILFKGKYYLSGDDTRMYYIYPFEYFKEFTFSSWHHFSTVGSNSPTQFMVPFLLLWSLLSMVIPSKVVLDYLGFSSPLILGFIFLQLFINELLNIKRSSVEAFLGALFFICSPILMTSQLFIFLSTVWLVPLIPLTSFLFLRYLREGQFKYVGFAVLSCVLFSLGLFSIPWALGFLLPVFMGVAIVILLTNIKDKLLYLRRSTIFFVFLGLSQAFWFFSFFMTYFGRSDINYGSKILSKGVADTFSPTVLATAHGNIIYPLLNLFDRQIAFDFGWALKSNFVNFYDKIFILNALFVAVLFSGIFLYKKHLDSKLYKTYIAFLIAFTLSLYFFIVNIGPLKDLFLTFGRIPGFVMFRNFYDKFGLAYIMLYAIMLSFSFSMLKKLNAKIFKVVVTIFIFLVLLNFTQVGPTVNAPLWQTKNVGRNIMIPQEYLDFMSSIKTKVSSTNNIFTVPFGTALYSVIKDTDSNSVYTGTSPVKILSGVNDISGFLSFYFSDAYSIMEYLIINKDYAGLKQMLKDYNVNYVFVNKNIPQDVLNSWIFDKRMLTAQGENLISNITDGKPILVSGQGNYLLYKVKDFNTLLSTKNLTFKKINETKFKLYVHKLKSKQTLYFFDSYHPGWELFLEKNPSLSWCSNSISYGQVKQCRESGVFLEGDELGYLFKRPIFSDKHKAYSKYFVNSWVIDPDLVKNNSSGDYYKVNPDGSIDLEFTLYYMPQENFYIGTIISLVVVLPVFAYLIIYYGKKVKEKSKN